MSPSELGEIVQHQEAVARQLPTYKIFNHLELIEYIKTSLLSGAGMIITELDKFMLIKWEGSRTSYIALHLHISKFFLTKVEFGTVEINHFY
jgi:hypothetical protein